MHLVRLIYYSRNVVEQQDAGMLATLRNILAVSQRNNARAGLTGALAFDDQWFVQALEGPREAVWSRFRAIMDDDRHEGVVLAQSVSVSHRLFPRWSMKLAQQSGFNDPLFAPRDRGGVLSPEDMDAEAMLDMLVLLTGGAGEVAKALASYPAVQSPKGHSAASRQGPPQ